MENPLWRLAGVFADFGKTGTSTKKRVEFNKMIELCRLGEIDIILIKSMSRFARNTIDALNVVQELRSLGIEIYFENEKISTLDTNFDFYLTTAISMAEEESKSNSKTSCGPIKRDSRKASEIGTSMKSCLRMKF